MTAPNNCTSNCEFFRCTQKTLEIRSNKTYCKFADDICDGYTCKYASCLRNRLLSNGMCGMTMKRVTNAIDTPPESIDGITVKGKLQKKFRDKELF